MFDFLHKDILKRSKGKTKAELDSGEKNANEYKDYNEPLKKIW